MGYKGRKFRDQRFAKIAKRETAKIFDLANHKIKDSQKIDSDAFLRLW